MLEQSKKNGPVYHSKTGVKSVASKKATISEIRFGPCRPVVIHRNPFSDKLLIEDQQDGKGYVYGTKCEAEVNPITYENDTLYTYLCGIAIYEGEKQIYWLKNQPVVTITDTPDMSDLTLPSSLTGYPYEETFSYDNDLVDILKDVKSTYVDRFKRPINPQAIENNIYLPIGINAVTTTFKDVVNKHQHFPIVCDLSNTDFAVLDLEPEYTKDDYEKAEDFPYVYKEVTPRGGIHYLIYCKDDSFKYRVTPSFEIIINAMVTFYGNGVVNDRSIEYVTKDAFQDYVELGHQSLTVSEASKDVKALVDKLEKRNKETGALGVDSVLQQMKIDKDESHAEYMSILHLLNHNVGQYINNITTDHGFKDSDIPWILAEYLSRIIDFRLKHNREIKGVPYLVYVATSAYNNYKKRG